MSLCLQGEYPGIMTWQQHDSMNITTYWRKKHFSLKFTLLTAIMSLCRVNKAYLNTVQSSSCLTMLSVSFQQSYWFDRSQAKNLELKIYLGFLGWVLCCRVMWSMILIWESKNRHTRTWSLPVRCVWVDNLYVGIWNDSSLLFCKSRL